METIDKLDLAPVNIAVIDTGFQNPAELFDPDWKGVIESEFPKRSITPDAEGQILDQDGGNIVVTYQTKEQIADAFVAAHGTAVASVIAAANNLENNLNSTSPLSGVVASVPNLHWNLHMFSVGNAAGSGWVEKHLTSSLQNIASLENVGQMGPGIDVVNMSISKVDNPESELMDRWRDIAEGMPDVTFVAAAGNCERDASIWVPANWSSSMSNAITVGGTNYTHADRWRTGEAGEKDDIFCDASFYHGSAFGPSIRDTGVAAPAQGVLAVELVSIDGDGYGPTRGTSIATPMVTGTVALLRAISPDHSPEKIRKILRDSAETVEICTSNYPKDSCLDGDKEPWKFLRADRAVDMLLTELVDAEIDPPHGTITVANVPASGNVTIEATVRNTGTKKWTFYAEASVFGGIDLGAHELTILPGKSRPVRWEVPVAESDEWKVVRIGIRRDDINDPDMARELGNDNRVLAVSFVNISVPAATPTPLPTFPPIPDPWAATPTALPTATPAAMPQSSGGRIVFVSNRDGNPEIYTMNADGSDVTRLTNNPAEDNRPSWSPDGRRIAFESNRDGSNGIYAMNADGSDVTLLTDDAGYSPPSWSPDGRRIAFVSNRDGNLEIYAVNADGSGITRLTNNPARDSNPSWSPDGRRIAFVSDRDRTQRSFWWEIYVMDADGSGVKPLTYKSIDDIRSWSPSDYIPSWSPDSRRIAFVASSRGQFNIYAMDANGSSGATRLTNNSAVSHIYPTWSPDGQRIAFVFVSSRDRNAEIYAMNANGSGVTRLTNLANNLANFHIYPSWSPDGRRIAFESRRDGNSEIDRNSEIYVVNADGSGVTRLTNNSADDYFPSWGPAAP